MVMSRLKLGVHPGMDLDRVAMQTTAGFDIWYTLSECHKVVELCFLGVVVSSVVSSLSSDVVAVAQNTNQA